MMLTDVGEAVGGATVDTLVAGLLEISTNVLGFITDNSMLMIMFSGSLVGVTCYVLRKVKKTAKA